MKLTHFLAYVFAQLLTFCGMALGYQLADTVVIQVGMAARSWSSWPIPSLR